MKKQLTWFDIIPEYNITINHLIMSDRQKAIQVIESLKEIYDFERFIFDRLYESEEDYLPNHIEYMKRLKKLHLL